MAEANALKALETSGKAEAEKQFRYVLDNLNELRRSDQLGAIQWGLHYSVECLPKIHALFLEKQSEYNLETKRNIHLHERMHPVPAKRGNRFLKLLGLS